MNKKCETCGVTYTPPYPTKRLQGMSTFCPKCVAKQLAEFDEKKKKEIMNWDWEWAEVFYKKVHEM